MKIPFFSLDAMHSQAGRGLEEAFGRVLSKGWFILGEEVKKFEREYARYTGTQYCAGTGNGLDALIISLKALGVGPGDEVLVPSNTYIATVLAVSAVGAGPVFVEPDLATCNLDPGRLKAHISPKTRAILPVHLYGQACRMDAILQIAAEHGLSVVEDNAQAHGAACLGKRTGSFGHINATSFYPSKNLGALGDGGAVTTDDHELYDKALLYRNYGSRERYYNEVQGMNSRLDELQAAMLSVKLACLESWNEERVRIAGQYIRELEGVREVVSPSLAEGCTSVYHLFVIRTSRRDELKRSLGEQGIETLIHYPVPPHLQKAYSSLGHKKGDYPIAEEIANTCLSLPIYPGLSLKDVKFTADAIKRFFNA